MLFQSLETHLSTWPFPWGSCTSEGAARSRCPVLPSLTLTLLLDSPFSLQGYYLYFSLLKPFPPYGNPANHSLSEAGKPEPSPHMNEKSSERKTSRKPHAPESVTTQVLANGWCTGLCLLSSHPAAVACGQSPRCQASPAFSHGC